MGLEVTTEGVDKTLRRLASIYPNIEQEALEKAGQEVARYLKVNTPYDPTGKGHHAKDNVAVGKYKDGAVMVGYSKEVSWRMHFIEFGTIKQPPQGFVKRTEVEVQAMVIQLVENYLLEGLGL